MKKYIINFIIFFSGIIFTFILMFVISIIKMPNRVEHLTISSENYNIAKIIDRIDKMEIEYDISIIIKQKDQDIVQGIIRENHK